MKITDILKSTIPHISMEVFPPKTDAEFEDVMKVAGKIAALKPSFMSVTYGAGGGTSKNTVRIVSSLQEQMGVTGLAHLTCVSSTREEAQRVLAQMKDLGIENVLALRGDIPEDSDFPTPEQYHYASELVSQIRVSGDLCIGAACYPEGHVDTEYKKDDIKNLKHKVDCGVDFLITQMFFDNDILYNFLYRIREVGITVPVLPGIMPIMNLRQMRRSCEMSGTTLSRRYIELADRFGETPAAMQQAGIVYATQQIIDLFANGINHVHIYTMNKPQVAAAIMNNLSEIMKVP